MIEVVFDNQKATVYNSDRSVVNSGSRPQDRAFARNVAKTKGYRREEHTEGHKRIVRLWKSD